MNAPVIVILGRRALFFCLATAACAAGAFIALMLPVCLIGFVWDMGWLISGAHLPPELDLLEHARDPWIIWLSIGIGGAVAYYEIDWNEIGDRPLLFTRREPAKDAKRALEAPDKAE